VTAAQEALAVLEREVAELTVVAPNAGELIAPDIDQALGRHLKRGQTIGEVRNDERLEVFVTVGQEDFQRILADPTRTVQVRLASEIDEIRYATDLEGLNLDEIRLLQSAKNEVRNPSLTYAGGGTLAPDPRDPNKTALDQFEMRVILDNPVAADGGRECLPGQRAYVRVKLDDEPLARQWWRGFLQLIQTQRTTRGMQQQQ